MLSKCMKVENLLIISTLLCLKLIYCKAECQFERTHNFVVETTSKLSFSAENIKLGLVIDINYNDRQNDRIKLSSMKSLKYTYEGNKYITTELNSPINEGWHDVDVFVGTSTLNITLSSSETSPLTLSIHPGIKSITVSSDNLKICEESCNIEQSIAKVIDNEVKFRVTAFTSSKYPIIFKIRKSMDEEAIGYLEIKPNDCIFSKNQTNNTISCGYITPGWNKFDIFVNRTSLAINNHVIPMDFSLKMLSISGNYLVNCSKGIPVWKISTDEEISIPITIGQEVDFILTSGVSFFPVFNIDGIKLILKWHNGLMFGTSGNSLKPKTYNIIFEARSDILRIFNEKKSDILMELKTRNAPEFIRISSLKGEYKLALFVEDPPQKIILPALVTGPPLVTGTPLKNTTSNCLIHPSMPSKIYEVKSPQEVIPMTIFLSSSEKLNIQIEFNGLDLQKDRDNIMISSDECIVHRMRNSTTKIESLNCITIAKGWHEANISITSTHLSIGSFLSYSLTHRISYLVATANYAIYCKEKLPTWRISETIPIKIPLLGHENVNITLESHQDFSPVLHIMGNPVSLSWKKASIAISQGPPLPRGTYSISIYNKFEQTILTVYSKKCDCVASLTNLGDLLDDLGVSTSRGIYFSVLNLNNNKMEQDGGTEVQPEGGSKDTLIITVTSFFCLAAFYMIIGVLLPYIRKTIRTSKNEKDPEVQLPLMDKSRKKVDIQGIKENLSQITEPNNKLMQIYKLKMSTDHSDPEKKVQKLSLGPIDTSVPTKSILIIGETGTGKSSSINAMVNHIFGIELEDENRFILIENDIGRKGNSYISQTEFMTAYVLPFQDGMPNMCNYIIIDTPGFGDAQGFERDQRIMLQLENFLKQDYNLNHIDVIGLVVKAIAPRLTTAQKYIYDGLFSMFGKDINHNIFLLVTFAEAEVPPVIQVLKDANFQYHDYFKLDTGSLYLPYKENIESFNQSFIQPEMIEACWKLTEKNLQTFFDSIMKINPVSLSLTKVVLEENTQLRLVVRDIQKQITEGLDKITNLNRKHIEAANPEETKLIKQKIRHTEELLVLLIKDAQKLAVRLKEIPLRLDPLSVHGYISLLITNEEKERWHNYEERIRILYKLKEENMVLEAVINETQSPNEGWLQYFEKRKKE